MAINDPLGDLLTRIRNGQKAGMQSIASPASFKCTWSTWK